MAGIQAPGTDVAEGVVLPEWIDENRHMNVAWYVFAFDQGIDALMARLGVDDAYLRHGMGTTFAVESHITWQRELREGEPWRVATVVLGYDAKRLHQFQRMYHARAGYVAATAEWMNLHVDPATRRVSPWPARVLAAIDEFSRAQASDRTPEEAGRRMSIREPLWSLVSGDGR